MGTTAPVREDGTRERVSLQLGAWEEGGAWELTASEGCAVQGEGTPDSSYEEAPFQNQLRRWSWAGGARTPRPVAAL